MAHLGTLKLKILKSPNIIQDLWLSEAQGSFQAKFKVQELFVTRLVFKITELKINIREMVCIWRARDVLLFNIQ